MISCQSWYLISFFSSFLIRSFIWQYISVISLLDMHRFSLIYSNNCPCSSCYFRNGATSCVIYYSCYWYILNIHFREKIQLQIIKFLSDAFHIYKKIRDENSNVFWFLLYMLRCFLVLTVYVKMFSGSYCIYLDVFWFLLYIFRCFLVLTVYV